MNQHDSIIGLVAALNAVFNDHPASSDSTVRQLYTAMRDAMLLVALNSRLRHDNIAMDKHIRGEHT